MVVQRMATAETLLSQVKSATKAKCDIMATFVESLEVRVILSMASCIVQRASECGCVLCRAVLWPEQQWQRHLAHGYHAGPSITTREIVSGLYNSLASIRSAGNAVWRSQRRGGGSHPSECGV